MATFFLLPPRPLLEDSFMRLVSDWLPGLPVAGAGIELADALQATISRQAGVYLIFREELPEGVEAADALRDLFGAESGDDIIELRSMGPPGSVAPRRWRFDAAAA